MLWLGSGMMTQPPPAAQTAQGQPSPPAEGFPQGVSELLFDLRQQFGGKGGEAGYRCWEASAGPWVWQSG